MDHTKIINGVTILQRQFRNLKIKIKSINKLSDQYYLLLHNQVKHLENSFRNELISQYDYNLLMDKLEKMFKIYQTIPRPITLRNMNNQYKVCLSNLKHILVEIINKIGARTIKDIILLYFGTSLEDIYNHNKCDYAGLIYFYNETFTPTSFHLYNLEKMKKPNTTTTLAMLNIENKENKDNMDDYYYQYDAKIISTLRRPYCQPLVKKKLSLLETIHGTRLYLPLSHINGYIIVMNGYFDEDSLNISRYGGYLGKKNKELENLRLDLEIDSDFVMGYIEQLSLRDFIMYSSQEIIQKCLLAYNEAKSLGQKTFTTIIKEFKEYDLEKQRYVLTIFLLMKNDVNLHFVAYLLYDIISNESNNQSQLIYNSLHWSVKKMFKVAVHQVHQYTQKITELNQNELPYEKRICLMKSDDKIKSKAMEKYKEISTKSPNDDISKVKQYLDNLLRIPFGIYRKEKIINFLNVFKTELVSFVTLSLKIFKEEDNGTDDYNLKNIYLLLEDYNLKIIKSNSNIINNFIGNMKKEAQKLLELRIKSFELLSETELIEEVNKLCSHLKVLDLKSLIKDLNIKILSEPTQEIKKLKILNKGHKKDLTQEIIIFLSKLPNLHVRRQYLEEIEQRAHEHYLSIHPRILGAINQFQVLENKWSKYQTDYKTYLNRIDNILDGAVYGQDEAKLQIKRVIAQWINGESTGYCFGFEGSPGVGKTSLAKKGICDALKDEDGTSRPFAFIALGGSTNGSFLEGHGYTYVKSKWGKIVDILMESGCMNPIIYIDELDKVSQTEHGKELIGILTHLTDQTQNDEFMDKYYDGIKIDLSKVLFIFSYNDYNLLDPILADRIHRVKFNNLDVKDKIKIVNDYLMIELLKTVGFDSTDVSIDNTVIEYIIKNYTYEAGVRKLKEKLFEIIREINLRYLMDYSKQRLPIQITTELVEDVFSGKPKMHIRKIADRPYIGRVNGLYATSNGMGGLAIIESYKTPSDTKLSLVLTGQQGDVMKESMRVAQTVAWNLLPHSKQTEIKEEMKNEGNFGIHIHCPEAATPKDGPSGGAAITLAIISTLTKIPIKNTIAMTGEIDLNGQIRAIGGLSDKILGAIDAGALLVICPKENEQELKIAKEKINFEDKIKVIMVDNIWEIIELSLLDHTLNFVHYTEIKEIIAS
uniref:Lon proteolytic domain-containing protein n=1 Tax=viral metagenome TaxID=1070528 RepID=A0A6C0E7K7_9ZZZZ